MKSLLISRKHKKIKGSKEKFFGWLKSFARAHPNLFARWELKRCLGFDCAISVGSKTTQVIPISVKESRCLHILSAKCLVFLELLQIDYEKLFMNDHLILKRTLGMRIDFLPTLGTDISG